MSNDNIDEDNEDILYKIILLGDSTVGKTALVKKISDNIFLPTSVSTIGMDQKTLEIECKLGNKMKKVSLTITDTSGQERYKAITRTFFKDIDGVILMYDITDKKSFKDLDYWINEVKQNTNKKENEYLNFIIGNKLDLVEENEEMRKVTEDEIKEFCDKYQGIYLGECSNKNFSSSKFKTEIFTIIISKIFDKVGIIKKSDEEVINIKPEDIKKKKSGCCLKKNKN